MITPKIHSQNCMLSLRLPLSLVVDMLVIRNKLARHLQMNNLILVVATIPVFLLLVPNVYPGGPDDAVDCYKTGVSDGSRITYKYHLFDHLS